MLRDRLARMQLVGYGAGFAALATLRSTTLRLSYIVDDNPELHGQALLGIPITSPDRLAAADKDASFIIVFAYEAKTIRAIHHGLSAMGFKYLEHWVDCSPLLYEGVAARLTTSLGITTHPELFSKTRILSLHTTVDNKSGIAGTWLSQELLAHVAAAVPGSIAEMGVYKGGHALTSLLISGNAIQGRLYHLFDSFAGFPELSVHDPLSRSDEFTDVSLSSIEDLFADFSNARIHVGLFSETLSRVASEDFAFVYVDCDLYEPALQCCEFFGERLNPGGIMLFDDYWEPEVDMPKGIKTPFTGIKKAVDEFFADRPENVVVFPETANALIVKR